MQANRATFKNITLIEFLQDEDKQDNVLFTIGQVGESASALSEEFREKYNHLPWHPIIGVRNRVFHSYRDINMEIIYNTCLENIPNLCIALQEILKHDKIGD